VLRPCFTAPGFVTFCGLVAGRAGWVRRRTVVGMLLGGCLQHLCRMAGRITSSPVPAESLTSSAWPSRSWSRCLRRPARTCGWSVRCSSRPRTGAGPTLVSRSPACWPGTWRSQSRSPLPARPTTATSAGRSCPALGSIELRKVRGPVLGTLCPAGQMGPARVGAPWSPAGGARSARSLRASRGIGEGHGLITVTPPRDIDQC
jgi:hypothetical protein